MDKRAAEGISNACKRSVIKRQIASLQASIAKEQDPEVLITQAAHLIIGCNQLLQLENE